MNQKVSCQFEFSVRRMAFVGSEVIGETEGKILRRGIVYAK